MERENARYTPLTMAFTEQWSCGVRSHRKGPPAHLVTPEFEITRARVECDLKLLMILVRDRPFSCVGRFFMPFYSVHCQSARHAQYTCIGDKPLWEAPASEAKSISHSQWALFTFATEQKGKHNSRIEMRDKPLLSRAAEQRSESPYIDK
jgi:hypothetical protein